MSALRSRNFLALSGSALTIESLQVNPLIPSVPVITARPAKGHFKFDANDQPVPHFPNPGIISKVYTPDLARLSRHVKPVRRPIRQDAPGRDKAQQQTERPEKP